MTLEPKQLVIGFVLGCTVGWVTHHEITTEEHNKLYPPYKTLSNVKSWTMPDRWCQDHNKILPCMCYAPSVEFCLKRGEAKFTSSGQWVAP